jgi:hypothetical protein
MSVQDSNVIRFALANILINETFQEVDPEERYTLAENIADGLKEESQEAFDDLLHRYKDEVNAYIQSDEIDPYLRRGMDDETVGE